jgi:hypothetical protein
MPKKNGQEKQDWHSIKAEKPNYNHIPYYITLKNLNFFFDSFLCGRNLSSLKLINLQIYNLQSKLQANYSSIAYVNLQKEL